jgi:hypothetical protein
MPEAKLWTLVACMKPKLYRNFEDAMKGRQQSKISSAESAALGPAGMPANPQ